MMLMAVLRLVLSLALWFEVVSAEIFKEINKNWVSDEEEETGFEYSIEVDELMLFSKESEYQLIEVYAAKQYYGKVLVLDGIFQLTERDAPSYNEMIAHVAQMSHPSPKKVLVIGGGDGYVLSELLKYDSVEQAHHVELDKEVIETCKKFFPWGKHAWNDERVELHIMGGDTFVKQASSSQYDVIVQDSSDPHTYDDDGNEIILPASVLFTKQHFQQIFRILKPNGVFSMQAETFNVPSVLESIRDWVQQAKDVGFQSVKYASLYTSSYPTGQIGFLICVKDVSYIESSDYSKSVERRYLELVGSGKETLYYHPPLQTSSFVLPLWVDKAIYSTDDRSNTDEL